MASPPSAGESQLLRKARPLKVGLFLPFAETMLDGGTPRWADLRTMAQVAEDVGFDSLWFGDHLLARLETGSFGCWEAWSLLAAVAAVTRRIALGPLVTCTSYRNPALLAKMADTVDEISGGRLILGLGAGWHAPEFQAFGYPFDHRVSRFAEALQIIHGLLREGHVDFSGQYYQARTCELRPRGPQASRLPILVGSHKPRMHDLTARYADLWNTDWVLPQDLAPHLAAVDAACAAVGRDPATLVHTAGVRIDPPNVQHHPLGGGGGQVSGTTEELAALLRTYATMGIAHVQIWLGPNTAAGIEGFAPVLAHLDQG
jgi:alkanesulfonate monooxygenase SsuD/methylene tetrahydromethanopterin reductase-like flavin-dependent oxidoreductase (luciferase family)